MVIIRDPIISIYIYHIDIEQLNALDEWENPKNICSNPSTDTNAPLPILNSQVEHLSHVQTDPHGVPVTATVKNGKGTEIWRVGPLEDIKTEQESFHLSPFWDPLSLVRRLSDAF